MATAESDDSVWAVVMWQQHTFMGKVTQSTKVMTLHEAVFVESTVIPMPAPNGVALQRVTNGAPIGACTGPTTVSFGLEADVAVIMLEAMAPEDKRAHMELYEECKRRMLQARAQKSGISLVGPNGMPGVRRP